MKHSYLKVNGFIIVLVVLAGILVYLTSSCKTLQKTPEYGNYIENTDWKIRKL